MYSYYDTYVASTIIMIAIYAVILIAMCVPVIVAWWRLFKKAGEPGWKALIPFYSSYTMYKIAWKPSMFWIHLASGLGSIILYIIFFIAGRSSYSYDTEVALSLVGGLIYFAGMVVYIVLQVKFCIYLARAYGKDGGFAVGLVLLGYVFILILGFGQNRYLGPKRTAQDVAYANAYIPYGQPQYGAPPQNGASPYGQPQYGMPPQYGVPPQYGAPQYGAPVQNVQPAQPIPQAQPVPQPVQPAQPIPQAQPVPPAEPVQAAEPGDTAQPISPQGEAPEQSEDK